MSYYLLKKSRGAVIPVEPTDPFAIDILGVDPGVAVLEASEKPAPEIIGIEIIGVDEGGEIVVGVPVAGGGGVDIQIPADVPPDVDVPGELPPDVEEGGTFPPEE